MCKGLQAAFKPLGELQLHIFVLLSMNSQDKGPIKTEGFSLVHEAKPSEQRKHNELKRRVFVLRAAFFPEPTDTGTLAAGLKIINY